MGIFSVVCHPSPVIPMGSRGIVCSPGGGQSYQGGGYSYRVKRAFPVGEAPGCLLLSVTIGHVVLDVKSGHS